MNAHRVSSKSPRTDSGDGLGANAFISHCRREILQPTSRSSPNGEQDRFVRKNVRLFDPKVQLQIFHVVDFSVVDSLGFCRRGAGPMHLRSLSEWARSAFGQASSLTPNFNLPSLRM